MKKFRSKKIQMQKIKKHEKKLRYKDFDLQKHFFQILDTRES